MRNVFAHVLIAFLVLPAAPTFAATLYMDPASAELNRGDAISVAVRLDTDEAAGECVNAVDATIRYSESIQPVDISRGESIFSLWVEEPVINEAERTITFAGGIPNGYCGRIPGDPRLTNNVVKLVFRSPGLQIGGGAARNSALVEFDPATTVYLNDGRGTRAELMTLGTSLTLNDRVGAIDDPWLDAVAADRTPPEEFSISLQRDEKAFGGKYFIAFNTVDKQTGIDHYEIIEEPMHDLTRFTWGGVGAPWVEDRSPYVLTDQTLNSVIRVRAIDKAGNEYVATLVPDESLRTASAGQYLAYLLYAAAGALAIVLGFIAAAFVRRRLSARRDRTSTLKGDQTSDD